MFHNKSLEKLERKLLTMPFYQRSIFISYQWRQKEIAKVLRKAESAISYELNKFTRKGRKYNAEYANVRAYQKRQNSKHDGKKIVRHKELRKLVVSSF